MFTDAEFMTAKEKELVLKSWETFLKHGLQKQHFTKRLYKHLHLHHGYIAHYNIDIFYSTFFEAGQDVQRFFNHFCNHAVIADYRDLHAAMLEVYGRYRDSIMQQAEDDITVALNRLEASLGRAKNDREFAKQFLGSIRI